MIHLFRISTVAAGRLEAAFETSTGLLHLLEASDFSSIRPLGDRISSLEHQIARRLESLGLQQVDGQRFLLYCSTGEAAEYSEGSFRLLDLEHTDLYKPFAKKLSMRRICNQLSAGFQ